MATVFKTKVIKAAACTTCTKRAGEKSVSKSPNNKALPTMPTNIITYMKPTTLACLSGVVKSVARAKPAVGHPTPTQVRAMVI